MLRHLRPIALFGALLVAACASELPLSLPVGATLVVFDADYGSTRTLTPLDGAYYSLERWVANNRTGWSRYSYTTPSRGIFVRGGGLYLQFQGSSVLVTTPDGVFAKSVPISDYAFLKRQ